MKFSHIGIAAAALFGFGLTAAPAMAQHGPDHRGPGMHRPGPRPHMRPHYRKKRVCQMVRRHGHRERRCFYR